MQKKFLVNDLRLKPNRLDGSHTPWISSYNVNIYKYFRIHQVTSEEESVAEALLLAYVSDSVTCHVTNLVKIVRIVIGHFLNTNQH